MPEVRAKLTPTRWISQSHAALVAAGAGLALLAYLLASSRVEGIGFPLDDAWIHQTYARSLGERGEWAFLPGQPSAGSTAPLWSALLAVGYALGIPYLAWTFFLGGLSLFGLSLAGEALFRVFAPAASRRLPWAGLFLVGEWHLAWSAVSGMETLLSGFFVLLALILAGQARGRGWALVGLVAGLAVWVRPDAITLLGPAGLVVLGGGHSWRERLACMAWLGAGLLLFFLPYLLFNLFVQGSLWPNTFYAKQAEYAIHRQIPLLERAASQLSLPLVGAGLFLLPGFLFLARKAWQERNWAVLAAEAWSVGYALLYALRLPVSYQYGRYVMPAMPVYFVAGLAGMVLIVDKLREGRLARQVARVWILSAAGVWLGFLAIGAARYAQDVAIIQTEMVAAARWVAENTEPEALVAAHDIGALGYFGKRDLVDLAGLVSPEVIPIIRDEEKIGSWLDQEGIDYLVILSGWYDRLPEGKPVLYRSGGKYSIRSGGSNVQVYQWRP